jgi:hypothetical protein
MTDERRSTVELLKQKYAHNQHNQPQSHHPSSIQKGSMSNTPRNCRINILLKITIPITHHIPWWPILTHKKPAKRFFAIGTKTIVVFRAVCNSAPNLRSRLPHELREMAR